MSNFMFALIFSTLCLTTLANLSAEDQWKNFKLTHRKTYAQPEEQYRFKVFQNNLVLAQKYQELDPQARYGVTKFSDLTPQEFKYRYFGFVKPSSQKSEEQNYYKPKFDEIPESWNWVEKGAVTAVKEQGGCGSCWTFSAIQNIEGQNFIKHKELIDLSEQQLIDCDKIDEGCNGGYPRVGIQWLADHGGVASEADYPYKGADGDCKFTPSMSRVNVTGYYNISSNETEIAQSLYELGPLSIGVVADPWQYYMGGIANPWFCTGDLDHGVLLAGYGHGKGILWDADYWLVKNSWGTDFGENGYIRLERGYGVCEMNKDVVTATIA